MMKDERDDDSMKEKMEMLGGQSVFATMTKKTLSGFQITCHIGR
jgi:hypothetical protein